MRFSVGGDSFVLDVSFPFSDQPSLAFECYGGPYRAKLIKEYLEGLLGEILNCDQLDLRKSEPSFYIEGKENIITAINSLISKKESFIDKTNKNHRDFINGLISHMELEKHCGSLRDDSGFVSNAQQERKARAGAVAPSLFRQPIRREGRHHQGCVERCISYISYMFGRG